jgi:hypothetical protein
MGPAQEFLSFGSRRLRKAGVPGKFVRVILDGNLLTLKGDGAERRFHAEEIDRIRVGYEESKHGKHFQTMLWPRGAKKPLILRPGEKNTYSYGETVRAMGAWLAAEGGLIKVERGVGQFSAMLQMVLLCLPALFCTGIAIFLANAHYWYYWLGAGSLFWLLGSVFIWQYFARRKPRPIADLKELELQTPGANFRI